MKNTINFEFVVLYLENLISNIIAEKNYNKELKKNVLFHLDECLINIRNHRFYDLSKVEKMSTDLQLSLMDQNRRDIFVLNNVLDATFEKCIFDFMKESEKYKGYLLDDEIETFIINLKKNSDLYEELINYLLNNNKFEDEKIEVEGYTAEDLINNYDVLEINAYDYLMLLREDPEVWKATMKKDLKLKIV